MFLRFMLQLNNDMNQMFATIGDLFLKFDAYEIIEGLFLKFML